MYSYVLGTLVLKRGPRKDGVDQVCTAPGEDGLRNKIK